MEPRKLLTLLMAAKGLNANSLAERLKNATTQSQIHRFETGKTKEPKQATLRPVAEFFGLPVEVFYSEELATAAAERLEGKTPSRQPLPESYAAFNVEGQPVGITAVPQGTAPITYPPLSPEAEQKLTRFLRALRSVPHTQQAAALVAATEALLDHLP